MTDWELLDRFAKGRDEAAFAALVERHVDLVHGVARRSLGGGGVGQADDVVQAVFWLLARKAGRVPRRGALAGWLFRVTRYCCANVIKTERRREAREREASAMRSNVTAAEPETLAPLLDEGLARLGERERQAVLLHYLERRSAGETGAALGISREAAEKRAERGLGKLRAFFKSRGYMVPAAAVTGLLAGEASRTAPAAVAARALAAKTAAVSVLAQGVMHMMRWFWIKTAMACVAAVVMLGVAAAVMTRGASVGGAGARGGGSGAAVAGRRPMLVRWDVLMDDAGTKRVMAALAAVKGESVGYAAYQGSAAKLRAAILAGPGPAGAQDPGYDLFVLPHSLGWASMNDSRPGPTPDFGVESHNVSGGVRIDAARNVRAVIVANGTGPVHVKFAKEAVQLDLQGSLHEVNILLSDQTPVEKKQVRMAYKGDVAVGDAVVFAGLLVDHLGVKIWHVSVWESFAASPEEFTFLRRAAVAAWITQGVDKPLADADQAIAWGKGGKTSLDKVDGALEKRLANGGIVRLAAVSRPARWPDCWWDGAGKAIAWDPQWDWGVTRGSAAQENAMEALEVAVTAEDSTISDAPVRSGGMTVISGGYSSGRRALATKAIGKGDAVEAGVAAGPWKEGGTIAVGEEITVAGVRVKLASISEALPKNGSSPGSSWIHFEAARRSDVQLMIVAFDKQGKEVPDDSRQVGEAAPPEILLGRQKDDDRELVSTSCTAEATPEELGRFVVRWRAREWVTFPKFADMPLILPGGAVAAAASQPASRPASGPAAGTPEALMAEMAAVAATGDAKKLRGLMAPTSEMAGQYADMMAEEFASRELVWSAAAAKFGATETLTAMGQVLPRPDPSLVASWKVEGDRATPVYKEQNVVIVGPGGEMVRVKGEWKMEVALPEPVSDEMKAQLAAAALAQAAQGQAMRKLAQEIAAGRYKDAYAARDAVVELQNKGR